MSLTGNDPHIKYQETEDSPAGKRLKEYAKLEAMVACGQWVRCREAGLSVYIHSEGPYGELGAWVRADDVEKLFSVENPQETKAP